MKKIFITFLLLFIFCVPVSANTVNISDDLFNATLNTSSPIKSISYNKIFPLFITTENGTTYTFKATPIKNNTLYLRNNNLNINDNKFLDKWKNDIINNNDIYYIETIPLKKGIIYIIKGDLKSYITTYYIKNNLLFFTTIVVSNPISKNDLINLAYESIESIYPK
jgi:hypothetical protein|nr:MAG TPA: protein of unknown function (DUF4969) [Caudoviricetes sp.]